MDRNWLGSHGEQAAARYLCDQGYTIVDRNWRCEFGEVDVIARTSQEIVFVEVRTRTSTQYGSPEESMTQAKAERLLLTAQAYLQEQSMPESHWRIDMIAVECDLSGQILRLEHYPDALLDYLDPS